MDQNLKNAESVDLLQQHWRAEETSLGKSPPSAAKTLKILQGIPLPEKPEFKGIEPDDENLSTSELNQVFEIALKRRLRLKIHEGVAIREGGLKETCL